MNDLVAHERDPISGAARGTPRKRKPKPKIKIKAKALREKQPEGARPPVSCPPARADGIFRTAIETGRTRLLITGVVLALAFVVVGARLVDLTLLRTPSEPYFAKRSRGGTIETERSDIVDRNGVLLATSLQTVSLSANPRRVIDPYEAADQIVRVFPGLNAEEVAADLSSDRGFIWIKRRLTPQQQWEINRLGVPGLEFHREETRVYPHGPLLAHILGYTDIDNRGIAGIEKTLDERLRSDTKPLRLSLDLRVQNVLHDELQSAMRTFRAVGAAGVVLDARSGEVISMVSLPDFDPNHPNAALPDARFNRATLGVYELGSTFKIFTTAMALDAGVVDLDGGYDASTPLRVARHTIRDYHAKNRWLSVPEIFMYSSNIGAAKMAIDVGGPTQKAFLASLGFLKPSAVELPEIGRPMVPEPWRPINTMTIAFGHGLSISPLHLTAGVAAMVNGGEMFDPTLVRRQPGHARHGTRVISESTSATMRRLLRLVVEQGTGRNADAKGYLVGGKTGTAEKLGSRGRYDRKTLISSFVGAFPMTRPRYVIYAVLDEPQGNKETHGYATGGWVAAPVIKGIVERMAPIVGLAPMEANAPAIRQELAIELPREGRRLASYQ